ncbi:protein FAM107B-like [Anabas testudineus]|uniref:protein FAM107B-like n=1 Tax=Anabas testudineus TaxID=64144 RepID=UPI000E45AFD5|nr:protein FAM107B-like [Anabas testudineus]
MANVFRQQLIMKEQYNTDNGTKAEVCSSQSNPLKTFRSHNKLHKELLLAHKRGQALNSRSELQQVLEKRKKVQEEEGQGRTPLEDVLLRRQQKQLEREKEQEEKVPEEAQLMEFVRVRQNLRKIHTVIQNMAGNTGSAIEDCSQNHNMAAAAPTSPGEENLLLQRTYKKIAELKEHTYSLSNKQDS